MASKVPTAIGQVIEGKIISVTICHDCLDVSDYHLSTDAYLNSIYINIKVTENVESFFDISLPMPEENAIKKVRQYIYSYICTLNYTYV